MVFFLLCIPFSGIGQSFNFSDNKKSQKLRFNLVNNLIVVPVELNGSKLSFIVDSGVSKPILFNLSGQDSVQINNVTEITIKGLGEDGDMKALSSIGNTLRLGNLENQRQEIYVVLDKGFNLSPVLGIPVHGIIGYDLFRDFVVDINYGSKSITFYDPEFYDYREHPKDDVLPLSILNKRAFVEGNLYLEDEEKVPVKLMIDTGSGDAVWLFQDEEKEIRLPAKNFDDFLGKGLSGNIFGKRARIKRIEIGKFSLEEAKVAFPDMRFFLRVKNWNDRNGSLGGEVLKRFNMIFDYPNNRLTLRKNKHFYDPFQYNLSGIEIQHNGVRYIAERIADSRGVVRSEDTNFGDVQILMENRTRLSLVPEIVVSGIRAGSPADLAGLQEGDLILSINGKGIHNYKLQEITKMLNEKQGKEIRVLIERYNEDLHFSFVLKEVFK